MVILVRDKKDMNLLVVADPISQREFRSKFKDNHPTVYKTSAEINYDDVAQAEVIFDFNTHWDHSSYAQHPTKLLFVNSVMTTLSELRLACGWQGKLIGFNGLPGMFDRSLLELTREPSLEEAVLVDICKKLGTDYQIVDDRVGMVTPRVLGMIINEAFYTVQEGTASSDDIDRAMRLGTRYPMGPFEFCQQLGINNVYRLLKSLSEDTGDERYKICPLLKKRYLQQS